MILSVSRRTDIPAFYSTWFFNRVKEGHCFVVNPYNKKFMSDVRINPDVVDGIVFWTKNPKPMLNKLDLLKDYPFYFQYTVNAYNDTYEKNLPSLRKRIDTFKELSDKVSPLGVVWRYDPIILNSTTSRVYHEERFEAICKELTLRTTSVILSFVDIYPSKEIFFKNNGIRKITNDEKYDMLKSLAEIARSYNIRPETCSEDLGILKDPLDIKKSKCIDIDRFSLLTGNKFDITKDKSQRKLCGCVESVDIGAYNTCMNGCIYCYATKSDVVIKRIPTQDKLPMLADRCMCFDEPLMYVLRPRKQKSNKCI